MCRCRGVPHLNFLLLATLVQLLAPFRVSEGRVHVAVVKFRRGTKWQFVGKFGYGVGLNYYAVRLQTRRPDYLPVATLEFEAYLDEEWPQVEAMKEVCNRRSLSRRTRPIYTGADKEFGPWSNGTIRQTIRPHVWYFALSNCNESFNLDATFGVELHTRQDGGSHFSVESQWTPMANVLVLLGFTAFMVSFWRRSHAFVRSFGSLHPVIWALASAVLVQYVAQCLHTGHLALYRHDGRGSWGLEVLSEVFFMLSQVVQTTLLLTIALGYTLLRGRLGDLDVMIPVCFMVGLMHAVLVVVDKAQSEASHKFVQHEGITGWILVAIRLLLYAWFLWAVHATAVEAGSKVQAFLRRFRLAASPYFLAFPVTFIVVQLFAPYLRKPLMEGGLMTVQVGSTLWLANLFLNRSDYFQVSSLSASPLPGGGSPVRFFKDD